MFGYAGGIPLLILIMWAVVIRPGGHKIHVTVLGLFISLILTSFLTDVVKNSVGRPRPDLIARCKPAQGTPEHALVTIEVCTETNQHVLQDGWRSFPSGHSSFAFSGLGYLALYVLSLIVLSDLTNLRRFLAGQMHVFRPRTDLARVLLALAPLIGATLIAISRCEDYRHDVYDVTVGSLLGLLVAHYTYRRYYPGLQSSRCDMPFSSRLDVSTNGFSKLKDEEERVQSASVFSLGELEEDGENLALRETSRNRIERRNSSG